VRNKDAIWVKYDDEKVNLIKEQQVLSYKDHPYIVLYTKIHRGIPQEHLDDESNMIDMMIEASTAVHKAEVILEEVKPEPVPVPEIKPALLKKRKKGKTNEQSKSQPYEGTSVTKSALSFISNVPSWNKTSSTMVKELVTANKALLSTSMKQKDAYDKEYDRGKSKKVRKVKKVAEKLDFDFTEELLKQDKNKLELLKKRRIEKLKEMKRLKKNREKRIAKKKLKTQ